MSPAVFKHIYPGNINYMEPDYSNESIRRLNYEDKEIILVGTAHVSRESAELVTSVINSEKPDTVCVELCESRYQSITQKDRWQNMDIIKVIKEKKSFLLLSNLLLASFQKKIAEKFDVTPGEEMIRAIDAAEKNEATLVLADRDIHTTLSRAWRSMGFVEKIKLLFQLVFSLGSTDDIEEEDIERMKQEDMLESLLKDMEKSHPAIRRILIDERDRYLAHKIKTAPEKRIVAVVGAGHVPGIERYLDTEIDMDELNTIPPKSKASGLLKWIIPAAILAMVGYGFFLKGSGAGADMIWWWVAANGILAGIGAIIAFAHPVTIVSAVLAAPVTSLNPMVAAGWVSGLVEAVVRKPRVADMETLHEDILTVRGFWKNKVTRILLVVVFTNLGSTFGTLVAIPFMARLMG